MPHFLLFIHVSRYLKKWDCTRWHTSMAPIIIQSDSLILHLPWSKLLSMHCTGSVYRNKSWMGRRGWETGWESGRGSGRETFYRAVVRSWCRREWRLTGHSRINGPVIGPRIDGPVIGSRIDRPVIGPPIYGPVIGLLLIHDRIKILLSRRRLRPLRIDLLEGLWNGLLSIRSLSAWSLYEDHELRRAPNWSGVSDGESAGQHCKL